MYTKSSHRYLPTLAEEKKLTETIATTRTYLSRIPGVKSIELVGSSSRRTWIRGHREIDFYLEVSDQQSFFSKIMADYPSTVIKDQKNGLRYLRTDMGTTYSHDLIPVTRRGEDSTYTRAMAHRDYVLKRLTSPLRLEILRAKYLLRRVGLYDASEKRGGFSGWATEALVLRYGRIEAIPVIKVFECPITPGRNLLASVLGHHLQRFYRLRRLGFRWKAPRVMDVQIYQTPIKIREGPLVWRVVRDGERYLVALPYYLKEQARDEYVPDSYYLRPPKPCLGGVNPFRIRVNPLIQVHKLQPVRATDYRTVRVFNYFR